MNDTWGAIVAYLVSTQVARTTPEGDGFGYFAEIVQAGSFVLLILALVITIVGGVLALVSGR